jgi:PAS domain S-box-containing protein
MDRFLFDLNPNPILIYDEDSLQILEANQAFQKKYEYSRDELSGVTIKDIRPQGNIDELNSALQQLNEEGVSQTKAVHHQSKTGDQFFVNINSHSYNYGDEEARIVFIHDVTERVEAEREAQQAFLELNHHVNESPLAMIKWNEQFRIMEWSSRASEILGFTKEEVIGKTPDMLEFHKEKERAMVRKKMEAVIAGDRDKVKFDLKLYSKSGELIDVRVHGSAHRDEHENLISVLTFLEDISEQRRAEQKYQRLFENANDGIFLAKGEMFVDCNDKVCEMFECSRDEILGQTPMDFSPEKQPDGSSSREMVKEKIGKALNDDPQVFEWIHTKKDGTTFPTEVSLNKLKLGGEDFVQAIIRDLTEQKKAQEKLRRSERLFRKLFLKAPGALLMVDNDNRVKMVNQSFENLFGYSEEELLGKDIDQAIVHEDQQGDSPRMPGEDFRDGKFYKDVVRYTKDGEPKDILLGAIPVYLDDEPIAGFGIYIDITEQKENQRKLEQSLEEKRVLLEEIHHRVKNNLAIISGFLQLQAFEIEDEKTKQVLNDSQLRIQSIAIVHEMLYQSKNFVDISFEAYVKRLIETVRNTLPLDHQHIDISIEAADVSLDINQAIPCAILINELVTNSYKHAFQEQDKGKIWVTLKQNTDHIDLIVKDDGVGLPEDFSIEEKNSIGMNLIQTLTDQLNGVLEISSRNGTCFEVSFEKSKRAAGRQLQEISEEE